MEDTFTFYFPLLISWNRGIAVCYNMAISVRKILPTPFLLIKK